VTRHTAKPITSLGLSMTSEPASQLVRQWQRGTINPNPPYQRGPVWTLPQKIALIESLITGTPVPAIITNRRGDSMANTRYVIDGKQRLTAFREFMEDAFMVPASWFPAAQVLEAVDFDTNPDSRDLYQDDGWYVSFSGLAQPAQYRVEDVNVPVAEGRLRTVEEEAALYLRVNGYGTPQTPEDMERALRIAEGASDGR
jgi:hypothetical protein